MPHHQHAVARRDDVGLDGVCAELEGEFVRGTGVFWPISAGPAMRDQKGRVRRAHSSRLGHRYDSSMAVCVSCSTDLDPLWKYCITCGTPAVSTEPQQRAGRGPIPAAIRPDQPTSARPSAIARLRGIPRPAIVVIVLALIGSIASFVALSQLFS